MNFALTQNFAELQNISGLPETHATHATLIK